MRSFPLTDFSEDRADLRDAVLISVRQAFPHSDLRQEFPDSRDLPRDPRLRSYLHEGMMAYPSAP